MTAFTFGNAASTMRRLSDIYRKLPRRPWLLTALQGIGVAGIVAVAVWGATLRSEARQACDAAAAAQADVRRLDDQLRNLTAAVADVSADVRVILESRDLRPATPEQRHAARKRLGLPPDSVHVQTGRPESQP